MLSSKCLIKLLAGLLMALISPTFCSANPPTNDTMISDASRNSQANIVPAVVIQQRPEHVVSPFDGGHNYEQPPNEQIRDGSKPLVQLMDVSMIPSSNNDADLYIGVSKPEPRNEIEDPVPQPQPQATGQQDPAIIDHRPPNQQQPASVTDSQQSTTATTDAGQQQSTSTQPPAVTVPPAVTNSPVVTYNVAPQITVSSTPATQSQPSANYATSTQQVQSPPQPQPIAPSSQSKQPQPVATSWYSAQPPLNYQQQIVAGDTSSGGQAASASNLVLTTVQHPNSINALITSDNQARSMPSNGIVQQQQQLQTSPSQQMVTVNGQPMLLVNPNAMHTGGRRISISGWLKNISSILTNIFNRRDHGPLSTGQVPSSGGPLSHWMLGSGLGSHSWLTGAQQLVQQPHLMLASNRHQHQSSNYAQQPTSQQQQLQGDLQTSASSSSYATITSPQTAYQPPVQMMQLNQVQPVIRQASSIPLQQTQQVQTPIAPQPASSNQQANIRPASPNVHISPVVQQNPSQQAPVRSNRSPSNSGLPLAHYSRYSANMD